MKRILLTTAVIFLTGILTFLSAQSTKGILNGTIIHVAVNGSDNTGDGSAANPYATMTKASQNAHPGDTVFVHGGTYHNANFNDGDIWKKEDAVVITCNGDENAYIVFMPFPGDSVLIEFDSRRGVTIKNSSYVIFSGFRIKGIADQITQQEAEAAWGLYKDTLGVVHDLAVEMGIDITDPDLWGQTLTKPETIDISKPDYYNGVGLIDLLSHHIIMENNTVMWTPASGVRVQKSDYTIVRNNKIYYNTYRTSVGVGALTVAEARVLPEGDTLEGIKIRIESNEIHNNENRLYSWAPSKTFIHFVIDEGSGIFLTRNNDTYDHGYMFIANNLSYQNGASGIVVHKTDRVIVEHNTVYDNGTTNGDDAKPGGIGFNTVDDVTIRNNISWSKPNKFALGKVAGVNTNMVIDSNLLFNNYGSQPVAKDVNSGWFEANPEFVDTAVFNFRLSSASPAIDRGITTAVSTTDITGYPRDDGYPDLGAYEFEYVPRAYYVSVSGDNSNPGTESQPWLTVQYGLDQLSGGDTLIIMAGVYNEKVTVQTSGVLIKNYDGEQPVIDGTGLTIANAMIEIQDKSDVTVEGIEIANNIQNDAQGILVYGNCQNITLKNLKIHDIHFSSDPNAPANENTNAQPLIVYGTELTSISGLLITGNEIYDCRPGYSEALSLDGNIDGFEIRNNIIHDITNIGIVAAGHYQVCPDPLKDQPRNGVIKNNITFNCKSPYAASGGIYVDGAKDITIEKNVTYQNDYGIEVGCEITGKYASGITVKNNLIYNNRISGIAFGGFDYPAGSGKVMNCNINNNTLFKNDSISDYNGEMIITYVENSLIFNNIFSTTSQNIAFYVDVAPVNLTMDYNIYFCPGGDEVLEFDYAGSSYTGLAAFQAGTGQATHSIYGDPQFISAALPAPDLHLQDISPAINSGDPSYVPTDGETDIDEESRIEMAIVDMGADEFFGIAVELKVLLDGPFNGTDMNTDINILIPLSQPYNTSPWNYQGGETASTVPSNVVDWLLIEIRDTTQADLANAGTAKARKAVFLRNDGVLINAVNGESKFIFPVHINNGLFAVIYHRNHLSVMSAIPLAESNGLYSYDFTTAIDKAFNSGQKDLGNGFFGMTSGDIDASGTVDETDKTLWNDSAGKAGYLSGDFDMNGQVSNTDKNEKWLPNTGTFGQVPQ